MEHINFVKILGIDFNNDPEMTRRFNITKCVQKMENNVKLQNQRHLSLKGKTNNKCNITFQTLVCMQCILPT